MEQSATPLFSAQDEGEANRVGDHPNHVNPEADAEANKQRRKLQNRKNQRAHRLRIKEQDPGSVQTSLPFQVRRWRLDEPDDCAFQDAPSASKGATSTYISPRPPRAQNSISMFTPERAGILQGPLPTTAYNVFRAFVSNKRTLNTLLTGWTDAPPSPTTCPISGPYRDDTTVYPLNPNIPFSLVPTYLQQTRLHSLWINLFPFPASVTIL
ncbi:hypothetical protein ColLi_11480 [Colletotrichum liriopes]|uniref:BZIP domain-containing protein n=1 Tax=Colletotrichum liriopes TaxID=708192 RepID=A0AA37GX41_9PEZI|nr:hypothetical protein ColLi_11480 [Colletotrichum liriopes]